MKKIRIIRQHDSKDCGAACLCMICQFFGGYYTLQELRKITNTGQDGVSIWGLIEGAKRIGLSANSYKGQIDDLKKFVYANKQPIILHLKRNHFVVMWTADNNHIMIYDPAIGRYKYTWKKLEKEWSGYIISFEKTTNFNSNTYKNHLNKDILAMILQNKKYLLITSILSIIIVGITICGSYIFQLLIEHGGALDEIYKPESSNIFIRFLVSISSNDMGKLLLFLISLFTIMAFLYVVRGNIVSYMSKKIDLTLINEYIAKIFKSTMHDVSSRMTGEYLSRISDLFSLRRLISEAIVAFFLNVFMIIISAIILAETNKNLFTCALIMIITYVLIMIIFNKLYKKVNYQVMEKNAEMQSFFKESIQGFEVIKANNVVNKIEDTFMRKYLSYANSIYESNILSVLNGSISLLIEQLGNVIIIFWGFNLMNENILSLGELLSFYMILSCLVTPVKDILSLQPIYQSALIALDRVKDIQYMEEENKRESDQKIENVLSKVEFKNINFHYPGKAILLHNISLKIENNKKIVITGKNGSGKSTLIKILLGFEKVDSGTVTINDININNIDLHDIRNKISYVVQNNFLFADTIRNNITLGNDVYTEEELEESIKISGLASFLDTMPLGYNSYINENGGNLSVGQKQSIALARALIRKPQLLILDEATSNMDYAREEEIINNIFLLPIPIIVITHNQRIINKADEVLIL